MIYATVVWSDGRRLRASTWGTPQYSHTISHASSEAVAKIMTGALWAFVTQDGVIVWSTPGTPYGN